MFRRNRWIFILIIISALFAQAHGNIAAASPSLKPPKPGNTSTIPLPPLPTDTIRSTVISLTQGPVYGSLGVPLFMQNSLAAFTQAPFIGISAQLDTARAVHYFDTTNNLRQSIVPLLNSATMTFAPNMTTPGDNKAGQIIGATYNQGVGTSVAVAVWEKPDGKTLKEIRLYSASGSYIAFPAKPLKFKGAAPSVGDYGALIAADKVCVSIGVDQVCIEIPSNSTVRDLAVQSQTSSAITSLTNVYNVSASGFDAAQAMPDVIGLNARATCAAALAVATSPTGITGCAVNAMYTGATNPTAGQPLGVLKVIAANSIATYSAAGVLIGTLPAGTYFVMDATPSTTQAVTGTASVLYLVNVNTTTHYLIPSLKVEGFGDDNGTPTTTSAAIKDAIISGWGF